MFQTLHLCFQFLWWLIPPHGVTSSACIVHDYLYENKLQGVSRKEVDEFWLGLLKSSGARSWQIYLMYYYVRAFGWVTW
ncbi:MAG: DUF1353 domain-containing protein [Runella slithyformis]|nr:MAG: DUF1353 domain-containing protein [Runella slithyformis]